MADEKKPSQRELMRLLARKFEFDRAKTCAAFAAAEREGKIARGRNVKSTTPERYAGALWTDGERKGWLREPS